MDESSIQQDIQIEASKQDHWLMRNNNGAMKDHTSRVVRYGLGNVSKKLSKEIKSSDLIGGTTVIITPDMVGKKILVFTAIEVKKSDWIYKGDERELAQKKFIDITINRGGIAGFCKSIDQYNKLILKS